MGKIDALPFSIAILAGGHSRRMGRNKALISVGGKSILARVIDSLSHLSDDLYLVTNTPETYQTFNLPMVSDIIPNMAALGGIFTAISYAKHAWVFVVACDMPMLNSRVINGMATYRQGVDIVTPCWDKHPDALHSFYAKSCLPAIENQLGTKQLKAIGYFNEMKVRYLSTSELQQYAGNSNFLMNINTPEDLARVEKILESE